MKYINPEDVFANLEHKRRLGILSDEISKNRARYQQSLSHPGYLECIDEQNNVTIGSFINGAFISIYEK